MSEHKCGFVGLIGMPNAGKSTLVNALVGDKVSIVTAKPQTTRKRLRGICSDETSQIIIVDAPGVVWATSGLNAFIQNEYKSVIEESDVLLAILNLDEKRPDPLVQVLDLVRKAGKPWVAVITKSDLASGDRIGFLKAELLNDQVPVVIVSALKDPKAARTEIIEAVKPLLPVSEEKLYDEDILTTENLRDLAAEIVREKCFEELSDEIPYGLGVKIRQFNEAPGRMTEIVADIIVDKASHKPMVIGRGGTKIKSIGSRSRIDIERLLENRIFLDLHVVVKEKWTRDPLAMKELGYVNQE